MTEGNLIFIGMDMSDDYTQVNLYQHSIQDTVNISIPPDNANPLIPICLLVKEMTREWTIGEEAQRLNQLSGGVFIDHIFQKIKSSQRIEIYGVSFTYTQILSKYLKKILGYMRQHYMSSTITQLVITLEDDSQSMVEAVYEAAMLLGLEQNRVRIISKVQSFMYYILNQKHELWTNEVGLFHFGDRGLMYYRLSVNKKITPIPVIVDCIDLSDQFTLALMEADGTERFSQKFEIIVNQLLYKRLVTSLFFIGKGFYSDWADGVLKKLCVGRRVFKGQNLYTKGACYAAKAIANEELQEYQLLSDDMITSTIAIRVYQDAKEGNLTLAKAGTAWWLVNEEISVILDSTQDLELMITSLLKKEPVKETFHLDGLYERENKTIRLRIKLYFIDRQTAVLTVNDTGFGELYKTNFRIWEQILSL